MVLRQRFIIALCAGRGAASGKTCSGSLLGTGWRKRGEQKQAVGRSRGGRNTKIHALADTKGRLIAILLTGGEAHDCPVAERLIRRAKPPKRMLGDKAYDSTELREELRQAGAKLPRLWLPRRCSCMVDLMSLDPSMSRLLTVFGAFVALLAVSPALAKAEKSIVVSSTTSTQDSVSVRKHFESFESLVIQSGDLIREGH